MAANRHTHNFRKCSHASVGLAQARPNNIHIIVIPYVSNSAIKCHMLKTPEVHKLYPIAMYIAIRVYPNVMYGKGIW